MHQWASEFYGNQPALGSSSSSWAEEYSQAYGQARNTWADEYGAAELRKRVGNNVQTPNTWAEEFQDRPMVVSSHTSHNAAFFRLPRKVH